MVCEVTTQTFLISSIFLCHLLSLDIFITSPNITQHPTILYDNTWHTHPHMSCTFAFCQFCSSWRFMIQNVLFLIEVHAVIQAQVIYLSRFMQLLQLLNQKSKKAHLRWDFLLWCFGHRLLQCQWVILAGDCRPKGWFASVGIRGVLCISRKMSSTLLGCNHLHFLIERAIIAL